MSTWMEFSDQYFEWWQEATDSYVDWFKNQPAVLKGWGDFLDQSLQAKKITDQVVDEFWRALRLASREEVTRLHERLNVLESHLVALQERDWAEEVDERMAGKVVAPEDLKPLQETLDGMERQMAGAPALERVGDAIEHLEVKLGKLLKKVVAPEDLKPLQETLHGMERRMAGAPALERVGKAIDHLEAKLGKLLKEVGDIKKVVHRYGRNLHARPAPPKRVRARVPKGTADEAE